ncbi:response regulator transcription factor [Corynebacterium mustelae]|nr:response regulator transcription factor [Corynebacterium mustelae]
MMRILVADDQALVRGALVALLNLEPDMTVVAEAGTGAEVTPLAQEHQIDVALVDIEMPGMSGIEAVAELKRDRPVCKAIIVTTFARPGYLRKAFAAGADGFVVKDTPPEQLAEAIRRVHSGLRVIDPILATKFLAVPECPLTDREVDVARLVINGADTATIAKQLHLSQDTVRNHQSHLIAKTQASNRYEAARIAHDNGWL